jgi:divalent metal cation (Fe/Co/Zn/Cd) transporter
MMFAQVQELRSTQFVFVLTCTCARLSLLSTGAYLFWVIDPIGALLLAAYLMYVWGSTLLEQVKMMAGQAAPDSFHRAITYLW